MQNVEIDNKNIFDWVNSKFELNANLDNPSITRTLLIEKFFTDHTSPFNEKLISLLNNTKHIDHLLYLTQKRHRDHTTHQLRVAELGLFLMNCKVNQKDTLSQYIQNRLISKYNPLKIMFDENDIIRFWLVATLMHDTGYPLSHLFKSCWLISGEKTNVLDMVRLANTILKQFYDQLFFGWENCFNLIKNKTFTPNKILGIYAEELYKPFGIYVEECFKTTKPDSIFNFKIMRKIFDILKKKNPKDLQRNHF
jgi:hypothetical protein